jgi:hypothetical protein
MNKRILSQLPSGKSQAISTNRNDDLDCFSIMQRSINNFPLNHISA